MAVVAPTTSACPRISFVRALRRKARSGMAGFLMLATLVLGIPVSPAYAADYAATEMIRSSQKVVMAPGSTASFTIGFKNTGTQTWRKDGPNFLSIYTYGPKYRQSVFRGNGWYKDIQPVRGSENVAPGQIARLTFDLKAPSSVGTYTETFNLAAEDLTWIPGGQFSIAIEVTNATPTTNVTSPVPSASKEGFAAQLVYRSAPRVEVRPGEKVMYEVGLKNVGTTRWDVGGANYPSIYTYAPKYRKSAFEDGSWDRPEQPARMLLPAVTPGNVGYVKFFLNAPKKEGTYRETFHLAAENLAWIPGGEFTVDISVSKNAPSSQYGQGSPVSGGSSSSDGGDFASGQEPDESSASPNVGPSPSADPGYVATKLIASGDRISAIGGDVVTYRVGLKNTGTKAWLRFGNEAVYLKPIDQHGEAFRMDSWEGTVAARLPQEAVYPGQLAVFGLKMKAPIGGGSYTPRFELTVGERGISGGIVEVSIDVQKANSSGGSVSLPSYVNGDPMYASAGPRGPIIRVGLLYTRERIVIAASGTYQLVNGDHTAVKTLSGVTSVDYDFGSGTYTVRNGGYVFTSDEHVHFWPDDEATTIFEIQSYSNIPTWDTSINFNKFRGKIEVHYTPTTDRLWVIEELPIEDYIRGLAETSNGSPYEYQKALVTAARTYALYVLAIGGKHKNEFHDINTTAGDQVYKGYASELVRPNVVRAAEDTRGMAVHYEKEMIVTPYFSRSDGRTRAWTEVWGGRSRPWLVSVPAPYDAGKTLWGHGVGLAASDAVGRADAGASWTEILTYYYRDTEILRMY